jgi:anaerobic glycerol-3-phosphate dehydrogenase
MGVVGSVDVLVIGGGAAGVSAARTAVDRGARVTLVAESAGATALTAGWIAAGETGFDRDAFTWLDAVGLRPLGAYAFATVTGAFASGISGLASLLDITDLPDGALGVVDLVAGADWSAALVAESLEPLVQRKVSVIDAGRDVPRAATTMRVARALDTEGLLDGLAASLAERIAGCSALLFPPVLGLVRDDVPSRLATRLGVVVGEAGGGMHDPTAVRLGRAIDRALPTQVERVRGRARVEFEAGAPLVRVNDRAFAPRAVILATGGLASGGLVFDGDFFEPCANAPVWFDASSSSSLASRSAARGLDPTPLFAPDANGRTAVTRAGIRVAPDQSVLGLDGAQPLAPGLFAAGSVIAGGGAMYGASLAEALTSGHRAGISAARFALGR